MDILNNILNDLLKDKYINVTLTTIPYESLTLLHFSIGMYIRNKYLWHNTENFKILSMLYNTSDVDNISSFIINDLYFLIHKK